MLSALDIALLNDDELAELTIRLEQLQTFEYQENFAAFAREAWNVLEPGTPLAWSWHYDLLCEFLTMAARRTMLRGIVNVPPRTAKSFFCTIAFPCWVWTWQPEHRFVFASHAARLSVQHSVKRRTLIESSWYQGLWGSTVKLSDDQNQKSEFTNTRTGAMFATSVGAQVTGSGGNTLVLDDALSPDQARSKAETEAFAYWYDNTWLSRSNNPAEAVMLIVEQRVSLRDPTGLRLTHEPDDWKLIKLPLIAEKEMEYVYPLSGHQHVRPEGDVLMPSRFTPAVVKSIQTRKRVFQTQYQQNPARSGGGVYQVDWWRYYTSLPTSMDEVTGSWDMAFKGTSDSDYVVGQVWGRKGANHYLLHQTRRKMSFTETLAEVVKMKARFPQIGRMLVEAKANGPAIVSMLKDKISGFVEVEPQGSKYARAEASSADIESGNVHLEGPAEAAPQYVLDFVDEHTAFTGEEGEPDDQVDAQSQYLNWQRMRKASVIEIYAERASQLEGAHKAAALTPQQIQDRQPIPWSMGIRVLRMGIKPTEPIARVELERWLLDCRERGELDQATMAEELLASL